MQSERDLREKLRSIDHKSYPAYKSLRGSYRFPSFILSIDHVQGDPFAAPSHVSVLVDRKAAGFPEYAIKNELTRTALADELLRGFAAQVNRFTFKAKGSGKSGLISVTHCGQEVLKRTACEVSEKEITARFAVGFPANGRTINARELDKILFEYLPVCVEQAFYYKNLDAEKIKAVIDLAEDQDSIRSQLQERGLSAFVADGSVLPRESGISSRPMKNSVAFVSPDSLRVTLKLPHKGSISGMGIPKGITLIVGGGYHGKSTLLNALELGVYNHIAGDGREYVITEESALKLRSEDGRFIKDVDISMFISDLPNGKDTCRFSTEDASGSTSQAAGIVEGMEAGSRLFLLDEDTSATNFMVRDAFMQRVVSPDKEPITPFLSRARELYEKARFGKANDALVGTQLQVLVIFAFMNPVINALMYVVVALILAAVVVIMGLPSSAIFAQAEEIAVIGDVKNDGVLDVRDLTRFKRILSSGETVSGSRGTVDLNADREVDTSDIRIERRLLLGIGYRYTDTSWAEAAGTVMWSHGFSEGWQAVSVSLADNTEKELVKSEKYYYIDGDETKSNETSGS